MSINQGLNNLTIKYRYPLPFIGESLDRLGRAKRFTLLDLTSAYHRMRIREGDEWEIAFRTRYGYCKYQVILFGLPNAPASFQGYINKILAKKLDVFVIVYLDDILIYTDDTELGYVEVVRNVDFSRTSFDSSGLSHSQNETSECFLHVEERSQGMSL